MASKGAIFRMRGSSLARIEIYRSLARLQVEGLAILLIDKDVKTLTRGADRHYILEKGPVVWSGGSADLVLREDAQHRYLRV